jgi:hypothetical protein
LQSSGVINKGKKFDYFQYMKENSDKGRALTHSEFLKKIEDARAEKLKKTS